MKYAALTAASALLLAIAACSGPEDGVEPAEVSMPAGTETAATETEPEPAGTNRVDALQLVKLDCGSIYVSDLDIFSTAGDYAGQTDTLTDTCWLVRHPDGNLLWDLGLPGILTSQDEQTTGVFTVSLEETIGSQLEAMDLAMSDIDYMAISHSHFDHVGQVDLIDPADTVWLVNQTEYDYMFPEPDISEGPAEGDDTPPEEADGGTDAGNQFPGFEGLEHQIISDDHDVFGDGSVVIFMTPGHTPGHSSLLVNLPETGPVLLTGDLYHRAESRELKRVPQFNTGEDVTLASMEQFEEKARALNAKVIIQHEPADTDALPDVMR